jgi:putative PIN family toxin of toxin-antitoxin system
VITKVVLDTNVILSGIIFGGKPRQVLEAAFSGHIRMYLSDSIVSELREVLQRPKFGLESSVVEAIAAELSSAAEWVRDNDVIDCALEAKADYIVSGDRHLLELGRCGTVLIVSPDELLSP